MAGFVMLQGYGLALEAAASHGTDDNERCQSEVCTRSSNCMVIYHKSVGIRHRLHIVMAGWHCSRHPQFT